MSNSSSNVEELKKQLEDIKSSTCEDANEKECIKEEKECITEKECIKEEDSIKEEEKIKKIKIKQPRDFNKFEIENKKKFIKLADNPEIVSKVLKFLDGNITKQKTYEDDDRKIFLKNIPEDLPEIKIEKIFEEYGEIAEIRMPFDRYRNKHKGFAYLTFTTVEAAEKALKHKTDKFLILRPGEFKKPEKKNSLFVRNLPFKFEEWKLKKYFNKFSEVLDLRVPTSEDGRKKGFAFVDFKENADLTRILKNKHVFEERDIYISRAGDERRNRK